MLIHKYVRLFKQIITFITPFRIYAFTIIYLCCFCCKYVGVSVLLLLYEMFMNTVKMSTVIIVAIKTNYSRFNLAYRVISSHVV